MTRLRRPRCCVAASYRLRRAGHRRPPPARGRRAAELADLLGGNYAASATACSRRSRRPTSTNLEQKWVLQNQVFGAWQSIAARRRRHHVPHAAAQRRHGARREDRPRVLALPLHAVARRAGLLRRQQPRRRDPRRHAVHGHARRAPGRDRREERQAAVEHRGRRRRSSRTRSRWRRSS